MARGWQLWLSPRPNRTNTSQESKIMQAGDTALFEFLKEDDGRWVVQETHYLSNEQVRKGLSGPPLHIHLLQTEYFQVRQGVLGVIKNGTEHVLTKDSGTTVIPAGVRHRFWPHSSSTEDIVFRVWAEPQDLDYSFDESFLRHLVGYLRDCDKAGMTPSLFQIALFGCDSATVFTPPFWVPMWILRAVHYVMAYWIGAALLGYEANYPEYSTAAKTYHRDTAKDL